MMTRISEDMPQRLSQGMPSPHGGDPRPRTRTGATSDRGGPAGSPGYPMPLRPGSRGVEQLRPGSRGPGDLRPTSRDAMGGGMGGVLASPPSRQGLLGGRPQASRGRPYSQPAGDALVAANGGSRGATAWDGSGPAFDGVAPDTSCAAQHEIDGRPATRGGERPPTAGELKSPLQQRGHTPLHGASRPGTGASVANLSLADYFPSR